MGGSKKSSSAPAVAPTPTYDQAMADQQSMDAVRRRRGRKATILTGYEGVQNETLGYSSVLGSRRV